MRLYGVRGHDFGRMDARALAASIAEAGFDCVQLAPAKALSDFPASDGAQLSLETEIAFAERVYRFFSSAGLSITVLGCYIDPLHPDLERRASEIEKFSRAILVSQAYGAGMVATETGSYPMLSSGFEELEKTVEGWVRLAEESGARMAIEPVFGHTVATPAIARRLLDDIASPALGIVYDPANLVDPADPDSQSGVFSRALDLLGDKILAIHAKDFTIQEGRKISTIPGRGILVWKAALRGYSGLPFSPPILIEDQKPADLPASRSFIESVIQNA
jgi:L-ribulose-5-phosphate 3-epimerase